ncbi:MAG TPA: 2-oxoacid:acceptor oxidoreductase subunit alpha [Dehalococcoidales bacterium]|nr:2-oxoacid:acceptor oxidoreductase subunit alpha [Dehalococcoidales bacterium]
MEIDFNILVGGEAGQGVQSVGAILSRTLAYGGYHVFADQDYESRVRGGHNFFRVRVKDTPVLAVSPDIDILVALNRETVSLHEKELKKSGVIIHDPDETKLESRGPNFISVPLNKLAEQAAQNKLMANTVAVGAVLGLFNYDFDLLAFILKGEFSRHGEAVVNENVNAARAGYDFTRQIAAESDIAPLQPRIGNEHRMVLNGNEALCLGAIAGGCKFLAGYPMTPSSPILEFMADKGRQYGVVGLHVEDEISAMNMAVGAGYAGLRSMIATSGGGFALMVEALALAGMTETPVVAVLGQRPGPATGLPTRTEQAELWFAMHAGHGEFPRAVLAPATAAGAFWSAVRAFNLAEKYQTPVIILTDHHLASSYSTVDIFDLSRVKIERGNLLSVEQSQKMTDYKRHLVTESGISPRALPGLGKALVVTDSDEHDEAGHMIEDAPTRTAQVKKRLRKIAGLRGDMALPEMRAAHGSELTLIGWGSTFGAIEEAASMLAQEDRPVNTIHFSEVWPFPNDGISAAMRKSRRNVTIEGNATGQMAKLIRRETGIKIDATISKFDGRPFSPQEIVTRLKTEVGTW